MCQLLFNATFTWLINMKKNDILAEKVEQIINKLDKLEEVVVKYKKKNIQLKSNVADGIKQLREMIFSKD